LEWTPRAIKAECSIYGLSDVAQGIKPDRPGTTECVYIGIGQVGNNSLVGDEASGVGGVVKLRIRQDLTDGRQASMRFNLKNPHFGPTISDGINPLLCQAEGGARNSGGVPREWPHALAHVNIIIETVPVGTVFREKNIPE